MQLQPIYDITQNGEKHFKMGKYFHLKEVDTSRKKTTIRVMSSDIPSFSFPCMIKTAVLSQIMQ